MRVWSKTLMMFLYFGFVFNLSANPNLEKKLEALEGGNHFEFSTKKYTLVVTVDGLVRLYKDQIDKEKKGKDVIEFVCSSWYRDRKKSEKGHYFKSLETQSKKSSSSFSILLKGKLENGDDIACLIQGDRNKVAFSTDATVNPEFYLREYFRIPEAMEEELKGVVMKVSGKTKETLVCKEVYPTQKYYEHASAVVLKSRHPLDVVYDLGKSEGELRVAQYSHYAGSHLNDPFHVTYINNNAVWEAKKNTFSLSF